MSAWQIFFGWPNGQVWPNLVASAVTSATAILALGWRVLKRLDRHHEARMAQDRQHHQTLLTAIHRQTTPIVGGDHDHSHG